MSGTKKQIDSQASDSEQWLLIRSEFDMDMVPTQRNEPLRGGKQPSAHQTPPDDWPAPRVFNDLKIGVKLALAFGILVILALAVVWLGYQSSAKAIGSNSQTKEMRVPAVLSATQAQTNLLRIRSSIRAHLIFGDAQSRSACVQAQENLANDLERLVQVGDLAPLDEIKTGFDRMNRLSQRMFALRGNLLENEPAQRILLKEADYNFEFVLDKIRQIASAQAQRPPSARTTRQLVVITDFQRSYALMVSALRRFIGSGAPVYKQEYRTTKLENDVAWKQLMAERDYLLPYQLVFLEEMNQLRKILEPLPQKMFAIVESDRTREDLYLFRNQFAPQSDKMLERLDLIVNEQTQLLESQLEASNKGLRATQRQTIIGGAAALMIGLGLAFFFQLAIAGPVVRLTEAATQFTEGNLTARASVESRDEIGVLGVVFNKMTDQLRRSIKGLQDQAGQLSQANKELTREINVRKQTEFQFRQLNEELEQRVVERTAELHIAKEQAEAASRSKSAFLSNMSHELRTPLNAILGYADILKQRAGAGPMVEGLDIILHSGSHLLTLINDVLDLAKVEAGRLDLTPAPFKLEVFLRQVVDIFRARVEAKGLTLTYEALSPLPVNVAADERRLRQVLYNLLGNAVKFTDSGYVTLTIEVLEEVKAEEGIPEAILRLRVEDTGVGIGADKLDNIFQPFEQTGEPEKKTEGTGLGLAISSQIVEMMGSRLQVESTPGKGSAFWFDLHLPVSEIDQEKTSAVDRERVGYQGARRKVLIADDTHYNRLVLKDMLTPLGFEVSTAETGIQAVEQAVELRPDAILMDLVMPGKSGIEATLEIRQRSELKDVAIIAASASVLEQDQKASLAAGCNGFLPKPIKMELLLEMLATHLDLTWLYSEPQTADGTLQGPMVPPPLSELSLLLYLSRSGRFWDIRLHLNRLAEADAAYIPFVDLLQEKTKSFDGGQVERMLKQCINDLAPTAEDDTGLLDLAEHYDIDGILRHAALLEEMDKQNRPFADRLRQLAIDGERDALLSLVKKHISGAE